MSNQLAAVRLTADLVGGPGALDPGRCAAAAMTLLQDAAGDAMRLTSFSLEMGPPEAGTATGAAGALAASLSADKRTHAIAFLSMEARAGDAVAFTARAVFSLR
jgi:hypothetical protein